MSSPIGTTCVSTLIVSYAVKPSESLAAEIEFLYDRDLPRPNGAVVQFHTAVEDPLPEMGKGHVENQISEWRVYEKYLIGTTCVSTLIVLHAIKRSEHSGGRDLQRGCLFRFHILQ